MAVLLAPERPEPHYNFALVYERLAMLKEADQEALTALALDYRDTNVRNIVALVLAERGEDKRDREEWSALLADNSTYQAARTNLAILDRGARANSKGDRFGVRWGRY